jgi:hypothetical protein
MLYVCLCLPVPACACACIRARECGTSHRKVPWPPQTFAPGKWLQPPSPLLYADGVGPEWAAPRPRSAGARSRCGTPATRAPHPPSRTRALHPRPTSQIPHPHQTKRPILRVPSCLATHRRPPSPRRGRASLRASPPSTRRSCIDRDQVRVRPA